MPITWPTIHHQNRYLYVTEELPLLTVMGTANKLYLTEGAAYRIVTIPVFAYDGIGLATALGIASGGTYVVTYLASGGLRSLTITSSGASRQGLQALTSWGASFITPAICKMQMTCLGLSHRVRRAQPPSRYLQASSIGKSRYQRAITFSVVWRQY